MPSAGTSTTISRHVDVSLPSQVAAAVLLQRWLRGRRLVRDAVRLLGFLVFLHDAEVMRRLFNACNGVKTDHDDGRSPLSQPRKGPLTDGVAKRVTSASSTTAPKLEAATDGRHPIVRISSEPGCAAVEESAGIVCLCELSCEYEEKLHVANWERRLLWEELIASSAALRGASRAAQRTLFRTHPQLRRLNFVSAAEKKELVADFEDLFNSHVEAVHDNASGGSGSSHAWVWEQLASAIGKDNAIWLHSHYIDGKKWASARVGLPFPLRACFRELQQLSAANAQQPLSNSRVPAAEVADASFSNIDDIPPLDVPLPLNHSACDETEAKALATEDATSPIPLGPPAPLRRSVSSGDNSAESGEDDDDDAYSDEVYYQKRRMQGEQLEARLRRLLGMPEVTPLEGTEAGGGEETEDNSAQRLEETPLPSPGQLGDVQVPILGQGRQKRKTALSPSAMLPQQHQQRHLPPLASASAARPNAPACCAVCELDGIPFSCEVAEVDAATVANEELLWPCSYCESLVHWGCSIEPSLLTERGGSVLVFCSQACKKGKK